MSAKTWITLGLGAIATTVGAVAARRRARRNFGESANPHGIREIAADAFIQGDLTRGKQILDELPEEQRTVARCTHARKKQYMKGTGWKGWKQASTYRLYAPFVSDSMYGGGLPKQHPYTSIEVVTEHVGPEDGKVIISEYKDVDAATIIGNIGPTEKHANETRFLKHFVQKKASHREALRAIGYDVVVPCANVPLSGRRRKRSR